MTEEILNIIYSEINKYEKKVFEYSWLPNFYEEWSLINLISKLNEEKEIKRILLSNKYGMIGTLFDKIYDVYMNA